MRGRPVAEIVLSSDERAGLERLLSRRKTSQGLAQRARIVLSCAEGLSSKEVARRLRVSEAMVGKWRRRFAQGRLEGLYDEPRPGGPRTVGDDQIEAIIVKTLESQPANATHWSSREMARVSGVSTSSVQRIWRAFGLQPHRAETFKLSKDPLFIEKVRDVVGLYLSPPEKALVLCVDEKSQIQALDRSSPILPLMPGTPERRTHDYTRHGTTSLFAALDAATGAVIGKCYNRHRAQEFRKFLTEIEENVPDDMDVHIIMDNYATHKTPTIRNWFARRPRWHVHFTPTSASWLNLVERFFAELTQKQIKRGAHRSVGELKAAIARYIDNRNDDPKPFKWVRTADQILAAVKRYCERLQPMQNYAANS
ncbi:MAG: IS630 family transposase [Rhodomicrobium sp.]|nr:IS630 family transposase [Rhodomicrobium sp.]